MEEGVMGEKCGGRERKGKRMKGVWWRWRDKQREIEDRDEGRERERWRDSNYGEKGEMEQKEMTEK